MSKNKTIEKLTKEQEARIPLYYEKFLSIGMSTAPSNRKKAEEALKASQTYLGLPEPKIVWADSPEQATIMASFVVDKSKDIKKSTFNDQAYKASYGSFEAFWVSTYSFIANELNVQKDNLIDIVQTIVEECGIYFVFAGENNTSGLIIVSEKPVKISMNESKQLHSESGLALAYKDGTGVYVLNGIQMPEWLFAVPKSEISPSEIFSIANIEQRLQAIKWYGMEHFLKQLNYKVLDRSNCEYNYELLELTVSVNNQKVTGKALKMKNPSEPKEHVEGVEDWCSTVDEALQSRVPKRLRDKYGYSTAKLRA